MRRAAAATAAVALLLAGCATGPTPTPSQPTSSTPIPAATSSPSPTSASPATPGEPSETSTSTSTSGPATTTSPAGPTNSPSGPSPTSTGPLPDDPDSRHPWLTARSEEEPRQTTPGDWQEITGVRTGVHQTYDRVVLDLSGDEPLLGWFAGFTDEAIEDPTGLPLEVDGDAFLNLGIWAIDWTTDRPERYSGETVDNDELETVTQVVFGSLFEAQQQVVIGLEEQTAYRIFRLSDPARIVIDIRHD